MSSSTNDCAIVVWIGGFFVPFHLKGCEKVPIGGNTFRDQKAAEVAAKAFAELNQIPFNSTLFKTAKPVIALAYRDNLWYPAYVQADSWRVMSTFGGRHIGTPDKEFTIQLATKLFELHNNINKNPNIELISGLELIYS